MSDELNLDDLMQEARIDLSFDETNIERVSLSIPRLIEKYARKIVVAKAAAKKAELDMTAVKSQRFEYYTKDHPQRFDRRDVDQMVQGDAQFQKAMATHELKKLQVEYLQYIMNALDKASWNIGNAAKMIIFKGGG